VNLQPGNALGSSLQFRDEARQRSSITSSISSLNRRML